MINELEQFQQDLLDSVHQMKAGKTARVTEVPLSAAAEVQDVTGLEVGSQAADSCGTDIVTCCEPASGSIAGFAASLR
jgi:hypothetical protein